MTWIPLNVHSQYSILDSTASIEGLIGKAKQLAIPAIALSDEGNLFGAIDFFKAAKKEKIHPILGCKIWMAPGSRLDKKRVMGQPNGLPIRLFAKNEVGYRNLCKLSSIGFLEGFYFQPRIDRDILAQHREGLVCLSGSIEGPLGYWILENKQEPLLEEISWYQSMFGEDFYLEIQRTPFQEDPQTLEGWLYQKMTQFAATQTTVNEGLISIGKQQGIPLVATHDIHYLEKSDWQAHEILLNVQSGEPIEIWERDSRGQPKSRLPNPKRATLPTRELYFKSSEEIETLFADLPEAVAATREIQKKCTLEINFNQKHYPIFIPPGFEEKSLSTNERKAAAQEFLWNLCKENIPKRYPPEKLAFVAKKYPHEEPRAVVEKRLNYEFEILTSKGMSDYMLIVYDFISWAKQRKIPMGPGRGSAAGSLISYLIGITDIEPLRFDLFFERFINPERISYPDIDVDICMDRRAEVIDYVIEKYGKDRVAQIITFGTMKAKMAIRDVGRVLNVPLSKVNEIAALVPEDPTMTLDKAIEMDADLKALIAQDPEAARVIEMARKAEGSIRNTSTHAAGLIISAGPITDHIPVCTAKDSTMIVTQYAMKPVESVGMLKIDFLGLKTLTSLQTCADAIESSQNISIDWSDLPLDDKETFDLLTQGKTLGIFQLESGGMIDLVLQLKVDCFEEIIAVVALFRPGPMEMIPSYINRKHGKEAIEIEHPLMKEILAETHGVMVYQEQVMQIASKLAGYSLGEGDVLRRAMGKKDHQEMGRQREKFVEGSINNGIDGEVALRIFDKIEKFASYGFNKSHAAAYAYLTYATAYFKAHYPKEWMAALMTCDRDDTAKVAKFIGEAKAMQIPVLPPDINEAGDLFLASPKGIRFAISAIKGMGSGIVDLIVAERKQRGPFQSLHNFIERIDKTKMGKKQIELLVEAGSFDFTLWSRDQLKASIEPMFESASRDQKEAAMGVLNLFSLIDEPQAMFTQAPAIENPTPKSALLQREKELLGFYLTGHPMDQYQPLLARLSAVPLNQIGELPDNACFRIACVLEQIQIKISHKTQKKFAILTISDGIERFELPIWPEMFEEKGNLLKENQLVYALCQIERKEGRGQSLSCKAIDDLTQLDEAKIKSYEDLFDKLKSQQKQGEPKWKKEKEPPMKKEAPLLKLCCDADTLPLSKILALKELFQEHPGSSPIEVIFNQGNTPLATLKISSEWGVDISPALEQKLTALPFSFRLNLR